MRNIKKIASCRPEKTRLPLTQGGKKQAQRAAKKLKNKRIGIIFYSDILRTKQTAGIVGKVLGVEPKPDERLRDINVGILNEKPIDEVGRFWDEERKLPPLEYYSRRFKIAPPKGENYSEAENRMLSFLRDIDDKYQGKNILIVSHQRIITLLEKAVYNYDIDKFVEVIMDKQEIKVGEVRKL